MAVEKPLDNEVRFPEPLEFFKQDKIDPVNQEIRQREEMRWRLLGRLERWRMKRFVRRLAAQLADYNDLIAAFETQRRIYAKAKQAGDKIAGKAAVEEGRRIDARLQELQQTKELFVHYSGWLEYERKHRSEMKAEALRQRTRRAEMRQEAKLLESLLIDVFRHTKGCHYIYTDDGKEVTKVPKFERVVIKPDAHYFYLKASKPILWGWRWSIPRTVTVTRLTEDDVIANMKAATKRDVSPIWTETNQLIFRVSRLDSPSALPKFVEWRDAMRFYPKDRDLIMPYCVGMSEHRKWKWYDFKGKPHILIAGSSESGKSNLVNGIIATQASLYSPRELRMVLIDMKGGQEFTHWEELPHLLWDMVETVDEAEAVFNRLVKVMRRRMGIQKNVKAKNILSYNAKVDSSQHMERVLIIIDELNNFVGLGAQTERIHNLITLLVSQGRAVGMHIIASTQHPEVKVVPGRIQTNMATRLCGWVPNPHASQNILGTPAAYLIDNVAGRFAANVGRENMVLQVPYTHDEDISGVVSSSRLKYPDVSLELSDMADQPALIVWDEQRVLKECINILGGHLSGQSLHKQLGTESPGERHLCNMVNKLKAEQEALGAVKLLETGKDYKIVKRGKGYYISDESDEKTIKRKRGATSDQESEENELATEGA